MVVVQTENQNLQNINGGTVKASVTSAKLS